MNRKITVFLMLLSCLLLQSNIFSHLKISMVEPNLFIILVTSYAFMRGQKAGLYVGLISGFIFDLFWGETLGLYMLIFGVLGYANGSFHRLFYDDDLKLPLGMIAVSELIYGIISCFCIYILDGSFSLFVCFYKIIIPELIYTVILALPIYPLIFRINQHLENKELRSKSRFV